MIDIETLATSNDAALVSIAAVRFDLSTGIVGDSVYFKIDKQSCIDFGLKVDADTVDWWMRQNKEAQEQFLTTEDRIELPQALIEFCDFFNFEEDYVWGNGINFDCEILRTAYKATDLPLPWNHFNERDVITLVHFAPDIKKNEPFVGTKHHPIADCKHQIKYCCKIYENLNFNN
ncbi:3'-5' exonuclease [Empedobacter sp.]|uniref:3'-5' exonuclease n=1 Tax=Empedobacter sp. TaxID=1927715 RepID=UPI00289E4A1C|nr:3'-5' exonuclease [Empedobacter sp.]